MRPFCDAALRISDFACRVVSVRAITKRHRMRESVVPDPMSSSMHFWVREAVRRVSKIAPYYKEGGPNTLPIQ